MDLFKSIEAFIGVVDQGGFAAAARANGQSKAQVSRLVSALEDHLGVRLMQRSTRHRVLTEEGERYLRHAREIMDENARMEAELGEKRVVPRGLLKINGPLSWSERYLGDILPGFMARYPEVNLDVSLTDRFVDLLDEGFDVAIRIGGSEQSSLVARKLCTIRSGLFASPDYLRTSPKLETANDLSAHACLNYAITGEIRPWFFKGESFVAKPCMVANNGDILRSAALAGAGIVMLPTFFVEDDLASGDLVDLGADPVQGSRSLEKSVMAVYPERRHLSPKVRVFIDYLVESLREAAPASSEPNA